jgi:uncharacterized protein (DUF1800 family)
MMNAIFETPNNTTPPKSDPLSDGVSASVSLTTAATLLATLTACGGGADDPDAIHRLVHSQSAPYRPELLPRGVPKTPASTGATGWVVRPRAVQRTPTPTEFFDWAEKSFPGYFPSHERDQGASGLIYRYYSITATYMAVFGSEVLILGPLTGNKVVNVGTLSSFAAAVLASLPAVVPKPDEDAARFLLQAQFSASEAEIAAVRAKGYAAWLDEQLALPNSQSGWDWLVGKGYTTIDTNELFVHSAPMSYMVWYQLFKSPDAIRRRWALALSEVFVVAMRGIQDTMDWPSFAMTAYWDLLCEHGFGTYRTLLEELSLNPAMGEYLSARGNQKENPATGQLPDENYAREVMQLFAIGLYELNLDGSLKLNAQGKPIETYTASDVSNLARVFTGWGHNYAVGKFTSPKPPFFKRNNVDIARGRMVFDAAQHAPQEKKFLSTTIAAGTSGPESLRLAMDALANHPNNGPFLARQFIQRLVTSNPSPAYIARIATVFNNNGSGVRGDLKAVLRAILLDDEARNADNLASNTFGKLREPIVRIAQWGRTFKVNSRYGTWKTNITPWSPTSDFAQYPLNPPSVFSFYRPGYVPPGTPMARESATAPEFQIVNESTVPAWANFLQGIAQRGIWVGMPESRADSPTPTPTDGPDIVPDYSAELALVLDDQALVDRLNLLLCAGQLSPATVNLIVNGLRVDRLQASSNDDFKQVHLARALLFVMCSAEYLVQR